MKEKSQLEAMRAAIRGDLERARARREADPWRAPEPAQQVAPEPDPEPDTVAEEPVDIEGPTPEGSVPAAAIEEPVEEPAPEPVAEAPEEVAEPPAEEQPATEPAAPQEEPRHPGFFARLFGKS